MQTVIWPWMYKENWPRAAGENAFRYRVYFALTKATTPLVLGVMVQKSVHHPHLRKNLEKTPNKYVIKKKDDNNWLGFFFQFIKKIQSTVVQIWHQQYKNKLIKNKVYTPKKH